METTIQKENQLFKRKEIQAELDSETTPSKQEITKILAEKFSTQPEAIKIKNILGKFGSKTFTISADIYDSKEDLERTESKKKKTKEKAQTEQPTKSQPQKAEGPSSDNNNENKPSESEANKS